MRVTVNKSPFISGLYLAQGVADRKSTTPSLANVLVRATGHSSVLCAATDLRCSVSAEIEAAVVTEGGVSVSARHLYEIVKNVAEEKIEFHRLENNWLEIRAGKAVYKLLGMSDMDFPRLPEHREIEYYEVDAATIADMLSKTIFSVSTDDTRQHLNGVFFECNGALARMVSTDGHRLSKVERDLGSAPKLETGVIIPRKGMQEVRRLLENVEGTCDFGIGQGHVFVKAKDIVISVALVDAQFPPYEQVLAQKMDKKIIISRQLFLDALRRISIVSSDKNYGIRLRLGAKTLTITSDNPDLGEAQEELDVDYQGQELTVGFNARYFMDVLGEITASNVALELNGELDPGIIRPAESEDYLGVVMPMRI